MLPLTITAISLSFWHGAVVKYKAVYGMRILYRVGVAEEQTYTVKRVDLDYFGEE